MSEFQLFKEVIALSQTKDDWDNVKKEWGLKEVYFVEQPETCLCGHFPIKELCIIRNKYNSNEATIGNCCVKKFLDLPSDKIFTAVKRIRSDEEKSLNAETINHAFEKDWINNWELGFYLDIFRKQNRTLTDKQFAKKISINKNILAKMNKK